MDYINKQLKRSMSHKDRHQRKPVHLLQVIFVPEVNYDPLLLIIYITLHISGVYLHFKNLLNGITFKNNQLIRSALFASTYSTMHGPRRSGLIYKKKHNYDHSTFNLRSSRGEVI